MIDWDLTAEQVSIQDMARAFARQEIAPLSREVDINDLGFPEPLLAKMREAGFFAMGISADHGGLGLDTVSMGLVTEALCGANLALGSILHRNWLCGSVLETFGTKQQKARWLPGMASGALQSCTSGTEPEAGSDAANIKTTARREGSQFGQPIAEFQAVRHKLADMATEIAAARALAFSVARTFDRGIRCNAEAGMVKLFCSEMVARVTRTAMLLHGGLGYALETDANRYWRDGMLMSIGEGTHPGGGHMMLMAETATLDAVCAMAVFGEEIDGLRAQQLGLAWASVPDGEVEATAMTMARYAAKDPELARTVIHTMRMTAGEKAAKWNLALQAERAAQTWAMRRIGRKREQAAKQANR